MCVCVGGGGGGGVRCMGKQVKIFDFLKTNLDPIYYIWSEKPMTRTSKFHGEFMSPALFLFEVLKMGKLTRGPLVLYHLPKY